MEISYEESAGSIVLCRGFVFVLAASIALFL